MVVRRIKIKSAVFLCNRPMQKDVESCILRLFAWDDLGKR